MVAALPPAWGHNLAEIWGQTLQNPFWLCRPGHLQQLEYYMSLFPCLGAVLWGSVLVHVVCDPRGDAQQVKVSPAFMSKILLDLSNTIL